MARTGWRMQTAAHQWWPDRPSGQGEEGFILCLTWNGRRESSVSGGDFAKWMFIPFVLRDKGTDTPIRKMLKRRKSFFETLSFPFDSNRCHWQWFMHSCRLINLEVRSLARWQGCTVRDCVQLSDKGSVHESIPKMNNSIISESSWNDVGALQLPLLYVQIAVYPLLVYVFVAGLCVHVANRNRSLLSEWYANGFLLSSKQCKPQMASQCPGE